MASLAGYADTSNGGEITFALVLNGLGVPSDPTPVQRELAELLVAHPDVPAIDELGPRAWPGLAPAG